MTRNMKMRFLTKLEVIMDKFFKKENSRKTATSKLSSKMTCERKRGTKQQA